MSEAVGKPMVGVASAPSESEHHLRRAVGPWGSFTWGYADVGADVYVALGIVMAAAQGGTNVAFLFAGLIYICVGLAYTELAAAYPFAGGGQFYVLRGLGDLFGFVAGWAVLLDFTIDIALFALASAGYISFFVPLLTTRVDLHVLGAVFPQTEPWLILVTTVLVVFLTALNILGVRESSAFNEIFGALDIVSETSIVIFGFLFAFKGPLLVQQMTTAWPDDYHLAYGASLAIIALVFAMSIIGVIGWMLHPPEETPTTLRVARTVRHAEWANRTLVPVQGTALRAHGRPGRPDGQGARSEARGHRFGDLRAIDRQRTLVSGLHPGPADDERGPPELPPTGRVAARQVGTSIARMIGRRRRGSAIPTKFLIAAVLAQYLSLILGR